MTDGVGPVGGGGGGRYRTEMDRPQPQVLPRYRALYGGIYRLKLPLDHP